jgi:hypothetical protein
MSIAQKIPLARTLPLFAQHTAIDEIVKRGYALPGHVVAIDGAIVTVAFDVQGATIPQTTMPLFGPEYVRYPVTVGDQGVAFPASVYLGGVSGLGGGTADWTQQANLSTLVWFPVGSTKFPTANVDPSQVTLYGPNGVLVRDSTNTASIDLTPTGITMSCGGHTIVINSTGVTIDGRVFLNHEHTPGTYNVSGTAVTGDSGAVV